MDQDKINSFQFGLNKDIHNKGYQEGMYTFSLNSVNDSKEGDNTAITTELGNREVGLLPEGYYPIGSINTGEEFIVFTKDDLGNSEIGIINKINNYTTIINNPCLNFTRQIQGVFRILKGCDRIIYFVDGVNPDRSINIDNILRNPTDHSYLDSDGNFDCSLIKLKPNIKIPIISRTYVNNTGGNLELGSYQIILQYEDSNRNDTYYFFHSQELKIIQGQYNGDYNNLTGGDPLFYPNTTKSITIDFTGLDQSYKYLKIIVGYTKNSVTTYYEVDRIAIVDTNLTYILSTINTDAVNVIDPAAIIVENNPYDTSETITQHDSRLIRGNLKSKNINFAAFQKYANNICVNYITKALPATDSNQNSGSSKSNTYYMDYKSYMRDEIYSLAIVPIFLDGTEGPAFHIPGRALNTRCSGAFPSTDPNTHSRPDHSTGFRDQGWDSAYIPASDTHGNLLPDFKHIPEDEFESLFIINPNRKYIPRWKAFNTAYRTYVSSTINTFETYSKGEMAFWESTYRYPVIKDCTDEYIYPIEQIGDKIVGQKIRHHKMPDTTLEKHFDASDEEYIFSLGIELSNIEFPPEYLNQIQGYYIVREKRDFVNKTIFDKGIIFRNSFFKLTQFCDENTLEEYSTQTTTYNLHNFQDGLVYSSGGINGTHVDNGIIPLYSEIDIDCGNTGHRNNDGGSNESLESVKQFQNYDNSSHSFHGPIPKFRKSILNTSLFKAELVINGTIDEFVDNQVCANDRFSRKLNAVEFINTSIPSLTNRALENTPVYLDSDSTASQNILSRKFINDNQQETLVFETLNSLSSTPFNNDGYHQDDLATAYYGSLKNYSISMYGQLDTRIYYKASSSIHSPSLSSLVVFGGDTFITKFSFMRSSFNKMCISEGTNDDCKYRRNVGGLNPGCSDDCNNSITELDCKNNHSGSFTLEKNLVTYFVESEINTELRHIDYEDLENDYNTYYPNFDGTKLQFLELDYNGDTGDVVPDECEGGFGPWHCDTFMKNLYLYNEDYSKEETTKPYISLELDYNYCTPCQEEFPRRIAYSEVGYQEENSDNYRVFAPNNYRDLPANTGDITNLFVNFDSLFAHTPRTLYKIFTKAQGLQTDQSTLYVGTGEFFSIPPKELITTESGYAGSSNKWSTKTTEFGTFFVDDLTGRIFLLSNELQELSNVGLRNWFEENLSLDLPLNYYTENEETYPLIYQPSLKNGVGYLATYDSRHKRILLTKKDYSLNSGNTDDFTVCPEDNEKFINKSWTLSYSFLSKSWISWHSYIPNFYLNDANTFYSFNNFTSSIWKHNELLYTNYYGVKYNWIIEYPLYDIETSSPSSLYWISSVSEYKEQDKSWLDKRNITFDQGIVYNSCQSSGQFTITPKDDSYLNLGWDNENKIAVYTDRNWKLSGLRDLSINNTETPMTSDWNDSFFQSEYISNGYIDKVSNQDLINYEKTLYELADIKDKVNYIRLFFKPENNYKQTLFLTNSSIDKYTR